MYSADPSKGVELRALNDFTRLFINEEDELEEMDEDGNQNETIGQHT